MSKPFRYLFAMMGIILIYATGYQMGVSANPCAGLDIILQYPNTMEK